MAMKRQIPSLSTTRAKVVAALLITVTILSVTVAAAYYQTRNAYSQTSAAGDLTLIWGDPYQTPTTSQGTGSESVTVSGPVAQQPNLPGYYAYTIPTLTGSVHVEWTDKGNTYTLDATLSLASYENNYETISIHPSANSFYVSFTDYTATLTVNGVTTHSTGDAGVKAAAPGFFTQQGQYRVTTIILYAPSLGTSQYVIRWSQVSQAIDGVPLPAASQFAQSVTMTGY
jgi:hypothetical protein